jgi:hypothetical protein
MEACGTLVLLGMICKERAREHRGWLCPIGRISQPRFDQRIRMRSRDMDGKARSLSVRGNWTR